MRFRKPIRRGLASKWLGAHIDFYAEPFRVELSSRYSRATCNRAAPCTAKRGVYELRNVDTM